MSYYELEDGSGNYVLEDGTGNYVIESIVVANTRTLQYDIRGLVADTLTARYSINGDPSTQLTQLTRTITPSALSTETTLIQKTDGPFHYAGYVHLDTLASGDTVIIRIYKWETVDDDFLLYEEKTIKYSDLKANETNDMVAVFLPFIPAEQYKVTIEQTAGTLRTINFELFKTQ